MIVAIGNRNGALNKGMLVKLRRFFQWNISCGNIYVQYRGKDQLQRTSFCSNHHIHRSDILIQLSAQLFAKLKSKGDQRNT